MASRILPPFSQASRWPLERIVQHRGCASPRPAESAEILCRASARLGVCFRIGGLHHHGSKDDYFGIQIVHLSARMRSSILFCARRWPFQCFVKIRHCPLTAASVQCTIRHTHHTGRQHIPHHRGLHHTGREVDSVKNTNAQELITNFLKDHESHASTH